MPSPFQTFSFLFGTVPQKIDSSRIAEMFFWILALAGILIAGILLLRRIRSELRQSRSSQSSLEGDASLFQDLYRKKLISFDEYQVIKKRLRDQLVANVLAVPDEKQKPKLTDKELRLQQLLSNYKSR